METEVCNTIIQSKDSVGQIINDTVCRISNTDLITISESLNKITEKITESVVWYNDPMIISLIISLITSLIILFLGFYITEQIRRANKRDELMGYRDIVTNLWHHSEGTFDSYIKNLKKFAKAVRKNDELNMAHWQSNLIHISKLETIPLDKYYSAFIDNISVSKYKKGLKNKIKTRLNKSLSTLLFQLEFIRENNAVIITQYNVYVSKYDKVRDQWNESHLRFMAKLYYCKTNKDISINNNPIFSSYERSFIEYVDSKITNSNYYAQTVKGVKMSYMKEVLTEDILGVYDKNKHLLKNDKIIELVFLIRDLGVVIMYHDALKDFDKVFKRNCSEMVTAKSLIEKAMTDLFKYNLKEFCK